MDGRMDRWVIQRCDSVEELRRGRVREGKGESAKQVKIVEGEW